ncbi:unnamed protein product [Ilex paraguariensis]|uniref:Vinorine synthase-like n=1 Tax=Ilex paraguariensis TaxID=185542 RepID=A0ABC8RFQ8_9AQUA
MPSNLDQIAQSVYIPIILCYSPQFGSKTDPTQKHNSLKQSLSETLIPFYPLSGRIKDDFFIDCDNTGVEYVEAQAHAQLSEFLPVEPYSSTGTVKETLLAIQINFFDCGGMAIGINMSHKIADGSSLITFMNAWASKSRGDSKYLGPNFDIDSLFPPRDLSGFIPSAVLSKEKIVTRRFVFDKSKLKILKKSACSGAESIVKDPTRVEAVSAFIWSHFIEVANAKAKMDSKKLFAAVHAVNLRPKMNPPLSDHAFGNLWSFALANAIRKINEDYVKKLQDGDDYLNFLKRSKEQFSRGDLEFCNFSSWCRFPVYEVDYGWGKPVWVCTTAMPFKNVVILMSTRDGDGIDAWVNMVEDNMAMLEHDHKLLSLA